MSERSRDTAVGLATDSVTETPAPSTLLGDDVEPFERVVTGDSPGPLAVCGPPFGGREAVLDSAADQLGADLHTLGPRDGAKDLLSAFGDGPVVVDGCQHLYERRIGGFDPLDAVIRGISECEDPVVTGWNRYAWAYLARVRRIDRTFSSQVDIQEQGTDSLAALLLGRYDELPTFAADQTEPDGPIKTRRYEIEWRGHSLSVPVPLPDRAGISSALADTSVDPKDVVFERLAAVSDGNVGVATAIWEASRRDELRPSDIAVGGDLDLDREEAFCLRLVVAKERVERTELARIVDDTERVLGRLRRDGVISVTDDVVELEPTAVPAAIDVIERRARL